MVSPSPLTLGFKTKLRIWMLLLTCVWSCSRIPKSLIGLVLEIMLCQCRKSHLLWLSITKLFASIIFSLLWHILTLLVHFEFWFAFSVFTRLANFLRASFIFAVGFAIIGLIFVIQVTKLSIAAVALVTSKWTEFITKLIFTWEVRSFWGFKVRVVCLVGRPVSMEGAMMVDTA